MLKRCLPRLLILSSLRPCAASGGSARPHNKGGTTGRRGSAVRSSHRDGGRSRLPSTSALCIDDRITTKSRALILRRFSFVQLASANELVVLPASLQVQDALLVVLRVDLFFAPSTHHEQSVRRADTQARTRRRHVPSEPQQQDQSCPRGDAEH